MVRRASKQEVVVTLQKILAEMRPRDREKQFNFHKRIIAALRNMLKKRLREAQWLKNIIRASFDMKRKVNIQI